MLAGPLGIAATKGTNVGMLGLNAVIEAKSVIKELEAKFDIKNESQPRKMLLLPQKKHD